MAKDNIHPIETGFIKRSEHERLLNQKGKVYWFTGLSGSGKSTVALAFERALFERGFLTKILDGDNIRSGINSDLNFSLEDRTENIRRISEVSKLFLDSGIIVLCSFVSPTNRIRNLAKDIIGKDDFNEIFVDTPLEVCEQRDVKGLYKKARAGMIKDFTGIDSPFEAPSSPAYILKTVNKTVEDCVSELLELVLD
jgi:adenylylsulfate kinase